MTRIFIVAADRVVVLPAAIRAGPGQTNLRFAAGEAIELDGAAIRSRFIRNRIALGDLVEQQPARRPAAVPKEA